MHFLLLSSLLFGVTYALAASIKRCEPIEGKIGDSFTSNCEEYTCQATSDGNVEWNRTAVISGCQRHSGGRNRCRRPYGLEGDVFVNDCIEYTCKSRGRRFKWKKEKKANWEVCCVINGTLYNRGTVMDNYWDMNGCNSISVVCNDDGKTIVSSNPNCACTTTPTTTATTTNTALNPDIEINLIIRNSQTNDPVTNATVTLYRNNELLEDKISVDPFDGTITFNAIGNGNYNGNISALGYFNRTFSIFVDCMYSNCSYSKLLTLAPDRGIAEVTIALTWGETPQDLDIYVASVHNSNNTICITYYGNSDDCDEISLDLDQTTGGLNGSETVTLTDPSINTYYTYVIAVNDFGWENNGTSFTTSGATITIQDSVRMEEETLPLNLTAPGLSDYISEHYLFGCVLVTRDGNFDFFKAPEGTYFNASAENEWINAKNNCFSN